ncbi:MAG TPA: DNA polymerase III subunit beta [Acidimicrobiales bacterium]|nr:DNA polymerase III subunit beta [Acidimicrobiales bacterium]
MKFRCERDLLVDALATAGRAVANRGSALPVLSGLRFVLEGDELTLTGSDLELTISVRVSVSGSVDGEAVVPSRLAADVVRALDAGAVEFVLHDDQVDITSGRSDFSLRTLPADEFPRLADPDGDEVRLDAKAIAAALRQVVPAASADDHRPILTGVLLAAEGSGLRLVATDSYRLAVRDLPGTSVLSEGKSVLVPSRALAELARVLEHDESVTVRFGERDAAFRSGSVELTTRLIEGEFPNYQGLIPSHQPNRLTVGRDVLLDAVRRVKLLARESTTPVRLQMSTEGLELVAVTQDVGEAHEQLDAKYEGTELTVAFNPDFLLQGIEVAGGDEVTLETVDSLKPAVLRGLDADEFLYLLMPVRVQ